jgi:type II secretory pathway pseudopilin PulG
MRPVARIVVANSVPRTLERREDGFMMAALLVAMAVMMIAMTAALPAWQTAARREKEAELIFRGKQYARALTMFQRKYANAYPQNLDVLINERFLRKKYKDPITNDDFVFVGPGSALPTTSTSPLGVGASTRPGGLTGSSTLQTSGARGGTGTTSLSTQTSIGQGMTLGGRSGGQNTQSGQAGSTTASGGTANGIQAVYSKSKDKSLRVYNGYDHYNEWIFVATAATTTVTSPNGGQTPGQGTRGGAAGTRGGQPAGRGGQGQGGGFGGRGGQQPPAGGRGGGPGGANPFGGAAGVPGRGR